MPTVADEFERELEVFRKEAEAAVRFFYAWRTINEVIATDKAALATLNEAPLFWKTTLAALQTSAFIALGRVFDKDQDTHNIDRVLRIAQKNPEIFSLTALSERKRSQNPAFDGGLAKAYVPTKHDFRRLRKHVAKRRTLYEDCFRPLRHIVFAHKQRFTQQEVRERFAKAKIKDLQRLLVFLLMLHDALWELLFNGRKPILRPARYSVSQMRAEPSQQVLSLRERLTHETEAFLKLIASNHSA